MVGKEGEVKEEVIFFWGGREKFGGRRRKKKRLLSLFFLFLFAHLDVKTLRVELVDLPGQVDELMG